LATDLAKRWIDREKDNANHDNRVKNRKIALLIRCQPALIITEGDTLAVNRQA
jgi:hypothetical protein